jgi:hypothetical protein
VDRVVAPDIQLPQAARALGARLENGDQELVVKAAGIEGFFFFFFFLMYVY